jgi:hypothetical protein
VARARCVVAEAEIALAARELAWPARALDAARATLATHGDRPKATHAHLVAARRLVLIGRLDHAERALADLDPAPLPPASRAMRAAGRRDRLPAPSAEVDTASRVLRTPAARLVARGVARPLSSPRWTRCLR